MTWMTPQEEFRQGVKGLALHFCEAYAVVLTAYVINFKWVWWAVGMALFGIAWELGCYAATKYLTARHPIWKASFFGMAAFWLGAFAAGVLIILVG